MSVLYVPVLDVVGLDGVVERDEAARLVDQQELRDGDVQKEEQVEPLPLNCAVGKELVDARPIIIVERLSYVLDGLLALHHTEVVCARLSSFRGISRFRESGD